MLDIAFDSQTYRTYRKRLEDIAGLSVAIPEREVLRAVGDGLPASVIDQLSASRPLAAYARQIRPKGVCLGQKESYVAFELAFVLALAQAVLGNAEAADQWLATPSEQLGGHSPAEVFHHDNGAAHLTVSLIRSAR
ncbi:antitoxin Xre/MbcA/ParS toxin-binding domain-containing protein [Stutzerimonas stutzeri]|uniref:antitoxin Xre/MbcA/ParS toxin-binding domain-containing protein n=1 Tax=Stutzerimonas stutzeri TaxID=316 RepID=UPI0039BCED8A